MKEKLINCDERYEDFIGIYENVYPEGFCENLIEQFEKNKNFGVGTDRVRGEGAERHKKDDYQVFCNAKNFVFDPWQNNNPQDVFFDGLQHCFLKYAEKYSILSDAKINCNTMKMQKTTSGGGYHIWHCEQGGGDHANRGLVYSLYLNTLPETSNGETEFLYQQKRISPKENTIIIWPAGFTHTHRGNPVYGKEAKYIVTGWFYYE